MSQTARTEERIDKFSISRAADGAFKSDGLRPFLEYRDLGIADATGHRWRASISHSLQAMPGGTGLHYHTLDVQVVYVLKGWAVFDYAQYGNFRCEPGDCLSQPSGIVHQQSDRSADCYVLELVSPQEFPTYESGLTPFVEPDPSTGRTDKFSFVQASKTPFIAHPLRPWLERRDLGIAAATGGRVNAHVSRCREPMPGPTGLHSHDLDFQMVYVLSGTCTFDYGPEGVHTLRTGDCVYQPPGIPHDLLERSTDCQILEITSPAEFGTKELA
jgi:quercetin dioxygenase-like cupin family protein